MYSLTRVEFYAPSPMRTRYMNLKTIRGLLVPLSQNALLLRLSILVLASSGLACFELVKVPSTDGEASLVLVHTLPELVDVVCACTLSLVLR